MTTEVLEWVDTIKNTIVSQQKEIQEKDNRINELLKKNDELNDELSNLKKVSLVAGLTRQLDDKNSQISIMKKQLESYKKKETKETKLIEEESESESEDIQVEEGFELVEHDDIKLLKNIESRKLYYLSDKGSKGKYAGKMSSKGKIKLKN